MTEFEAATLAWQQAQLGVQQAQLGLLEAQLGLQFWQMWAAFAIPVVGLIQAAVVMFGISQMRRAGDQRAARDDARHEEAMAAHAATMRALEVLIERTSRA